SALTLPATALLLAALAWPAFPVILRHSLYKPTDTQVWIFAALGVIGAPASAWAAFVVGSRAGRTRRAAACAGLAVAAAAFAPSWAWGASRHLAARNAPLQFHLAWAGVNGRYAFVNVGRGGVDDDRDGRCSALVVDLADGSWRFAGPRDASAFLPLPSFRRDRSEPESPCDRPIVLKECTVEPWIESLVDPETAQPWGVRSVDVADGVSPSAFGLEQGPLTWSVTPAGVGLRLQYRDGNRTRFRYLDRSGLAVAEDALPRDEHDRAPKFVLIRPGRWLVHAPKGWLLFDPVTGSHERWSHCARNETIGSVLHDGRAVLLSGRRLHLLDVETGARTELRAQDGAPVEANIFQVPGGGPWSSLPADRPSLVSLGEFPYDSRLAWFDPTNATVKSGPSCGERFLRILWSDGPRAIVLEGTQRLAFHDLERNERRAILEAADVR
ncbi:MAG TPA: hypothetical protein VMT18_12490, partial [Planctomycetota bacterium]|nr:hypothetical protein [Planctomycetota bacterium]